jgi:hypothetical protein
MKAFSSVYLSGSYVYSQAPRILIPIKAASFRCNFIEMQRNLKLEKQHRYWAMGPFLSWEKLSAAGMGYRDEYQDFGIGPALI